MSFAYDQSSSALSFVGRVIDGIQFMNRTSDFAIDNMNLDAPWFQFIETLINEANWIKESRNAFQETDKIKKRMVNTGKKNSRNKGN